MMSHQLSAISYQHSAIGFRPTGTKTAKARRLVLWVVAALALATFCRRAEARVIGRAGEINLGRETASYVERLLPVDRDPVAVARVRAIGRRLVSVVDDPNFPFEFHVIEDGAVNAFSLPGGFIYVYRGLLQLLPNDDALAFVLAHELAHAVKHHSINQLEKALGLAILLQVGLGNRAIDAQQLLGIILTSKFSRTDERASDRFGIRYMTEAGYDPNAAVEAMEVIRRISGKNRPPALLASHPAPASRIKNLRERAVTAAAAREKALKALPDAGPAPVIKAETPLALPPSMATGENEYFPLVPGGRWEYRVNGQETAARALFRVWEQVAAAQPGVYRASWDFGYGVGVDQLIATGSDRLLTRPLDAGSGAAWRVEARFASGSAESDSRFRVAGTETLQVLAGEYQALKVERLDGDGKVTETLWYASGVGLIKRVSADGSLALELERYRLPKPLQPITAAKPTEPTPKSSPTD